jgi:hypothetical protein
LLKEEDVRPSPIFFRFTLALLTFALSADVVFAASNLNLSKSNINRFAPLDPADLNALHACKANGGRPGKDLRGQATCVTTDPAAIKACTDKGGKLQRDPADDLDYCLPDPRTPPSSN